jgi:hypothetical protein
MIVRLTLLLTICLGSFSSALAFSGNVDSPKVRAIRQAAHPSVSGHRIAMTEIGKARRDHDGERRSRPHLPGKSRRVKPASCPEMDGRRPYGQRKGLTARTVPYSRSCWNCSEISSSRPCSPRTPAGGHRTSRAGSRPSLGWPCAGGSQSVEDHELGNRLADGERALRPGTGAFTGATLRREGHFALPRGRGRSSRWRAERDVTVDLGEEPEKNPAARDRDRPGPTRRESGGLCASAKPPLGGARFGHMPDHRRQGRQHRPDRARQGVEGPLSGRRPAIPELLPERRR